MLKNLWMYFDLSLSHRSRFKKKKWARKTEYKNHYDMDSSLHDLHDLCIGGEKFNVLSHQQDVKWGGSPLLALLSLPEARAISTKGKWQKLRSLWLREVQNCIRKLQNIIYSTILLVKQRLVPDLLPSQQRGGAAGLFCAAVQTAFQMMSGPNCSPLKTLFKIWGSAQMLQV